MKGSERAIKDQRKAVSYADNPELNGGWVDPTYSFVDAVNLQTPPLLSLLLCPPLSSFLSPIILLLCSSCAHLSSLLCP